MATNEQVEFNDISHQPQTEVNNEEKRVQSNNGGLQNIIRVISILPCFPSYQPAPPTPNIDQLKQIFQKFKSQDPNVTETSVVERSKSNDLSLWTEKVLTFLPSVSDTPENAGQANNVVDHFKTIKKFYNAFHTAGFESAEMETFFNSLQIYESVISIAFVMFDEHPDSMKAITENVNSAIQKVEGHSSHGCISLAFCGAAILSQFNTLLGAIDQKIGEFGIVKVAEFVAQIIEVFCKFFNIDVNDTQKIVAISESIQDMVKSISSSLRSIFGDAIPTMDRKSEYGPMDITEKIASKLSKFGEQAPIVQRTVTSFENFFKSVEKVDDNFEKMSKKTQKAQLRAAAPNDISPQGEEQDEDTMKVSVTQTLAAQIASNQDSALSEVKEIAKIVQHLETIMSYGILIFKNEDEILNPLLDLIDEGARILNKYSVLHPLYQILLGKNYLSKLKLVIKQIAKLLQNSKLKINSPKEFLTEMKQKYPDLLYLLCESLLNDNLKKKLEFLPDPLENALNGALDGALSKFKNKFKF